MLRTGNITRKQLDALDSFRCGNIGMGLLHTGLALMDLTGAGALTKGLLVGTMKLSARKAIRNAYKKSANWAGMRARLQRAKEIVKNQNSVPHGSRATTDHIFIKQGMGKAHKWTNPQRIFKQMFRKDSMHNLNT